MTQPADARWREEVSEWRIFCGPKARGGHRIPNTFHVRCGFVRCNRWNHSEGRECGRWVFVLAVGDGKAIIAEVTWAEIQAMKRMGTDEMLDFLGIALEAG